MHDMGEQLFLQFWDAGEQKQAQYWGRRTKIHWKLVYIKVHSHLSFTHYLTKPLVFELLSREPDNKTPLVMEKFRLTMVGFFGHKLKLG